jgi:hypothetical protein
VGIGGLIAIAAAPDLPSWPAYGLGAIGLVGLYGVFAPLLGLYPWSEQRPRTHQSDSRTRRLLRKMSPLGGLAAAALLALLIADIADQGPPRRVGPSPSPSAVSATGVVIVPTATSYATPSLRGMPVGRFAFSEHIVVHGYCIGPPTRSTSTAVFDERWLVLAEHRLMPAWMVQVSLPSGLRPLPCAHDGREAVGGPHTIELRVNEVRRELVLSATAPYATTVGFAIFNARLDSWRPVSLQQGHGGRFEVRMLAGPAAVAAAAACWASEAPAHPDGGHEVVAKLAPVRSTPRRLLDYAALHAVRGVESACSLEAYGTPSGYTSEHTRTHQRSRSTRTPLSRSPGTKASTLPKIVVETSTSPQTHTSTMTSTETSTGNSQVTTGPERTRDFEHHEPPAG